MWCESCPSVSAACLASGVNSGVVVARVGWIPDEAKQLPLPAPTGTHTCAPQAVRAHLCPCRWPSPPPRCCRSCSPHPPSPPWPPASPRPARLWFGGKPNRAVKLSLWDSAINHSPHLRHDLQLLLHLQ